MENNQNTPFLIRKLFIVIELVLLFLSVIAVYLHYSLVNDLLAMLVFSLLFVWYAIKAFAPDKELGFKPRIIYFCCAIPCLAILFALMGWKTYHLLLVIALAAMAIGWGVFLWSRQRDKDQRAARQASSYMMFFRLVIYTGACLFLLLSEKIL